MGGKLFDLPRMPRADYLARERDVRVQLDRALRGGWRIPRYFASKPDFGDLDVLVLASRWDGARAALLEGLGVTETRQVGHVCSTVVRGLQTDFFAVPDAYLDAHYDFMSFADAGHLIGRMARRFDLKFGERGLAYTYRYAGGNYKLDLEVTRDFARVCAFLELDYMAWRAGFAEPAAMFAWVTASKHFSAAPWLDADEATRARRAHDRPGLGAFVAYLRAEKIDARPADVPDALALVARAFPEAHLDAQVAKAREEEARNTARRARFSAERVQRVVPGVEGKELGELMAAVRRSLDDFDGWLLASSDAEIDRRIAEIAALRKAV